MPRTGLIFDIRRFSIHDGPGIRTTVFFKGCPLSCWWCHNPESRSDTPEQTKKTRILDGKCMPVCETTGYLTDTDILLQEILRDRIFFEESGGGVTFSGGEPLHQPEFLAELLVKCRKEGIHTAVDTSGYATSEVMARVAPLADLFLYDLKILDECLHLKYTGVSNLQIKKNVVELVRQGIKVEFRFPVIPGITDTPDNISQLREFLKTLYRLFIAEDRSYSDGCKQKENRPTLHLLPYHSMAKEKYRRFGLKNLLRGVDDLHPNDLVSLEATLKDTGFRIKTGG